MAACDQRSESRRYQYGVGAQESGQSQKYVFTCDGRIKLTIVILFIFKHEDCVYISFLIPFTKSTILCEWQIAFITELHVPISIPSQDSILVEWKLIYIVPLLMVN